uniref:Uncharacterized protein n=1 Tax=Arundo donax TaxID=35708 RepID=A0A0A9E2E2_ARUDO
MATVRLATTRIPPIDISCIYWPKPMAINALIWYQSETPPAIRDRQGKQNPNRKSPSSLSIPRFEQ